MYTVNYMNWMMGYHEKYRSFVMKDDYRSLHKGGKKNVKNPDRWSRDRRAFSNKSRERAEMQQTQSFQWEGSLKVTIQPGSNRKPKYKWLKHKGYLRSYIMRNPKEGSPQLNIVRAVKDFPWLCPHGLRMAAALSNTKLSHHPERWGEQGIFLQTTLSSYQGGKSFPQAPQ